MKPNSKRERSWSAQGSRFVFTGARGLAAARSRFDPSNPKRAHPPIPPHGRALTLRPRGEVEARALQVRAQGSKRLHPGIGTTWPKTPPRPAGTATNPHRVCCVCPVRFLGGHRACPVGRWANNAARAYRPTPAPSRWPRTAFLGIWGQPQGRARPGQR